MLINRRPDRVLEFTVASWAEFRKDWLAASPENRLRYPDGRLAIYRPQEDDKEPAYITLHPRSWEQIRGRIQEAMAQPTPAKRTKRCGACDADLVVARETTHTWIFKCPRCQSSEIFGKDQVGGTVGAGEAEVRPKVQGADLA